MFLKVHTGNECRRRPPRRRQFVTSLASSPAWMALKLTTLPDYGETEFEFWKIFFVWAFRAPCQPGLEWRRGQGVQGSNGEGAGQLCRVVCMSLKCEREPPPAPAALDSGYNSDFPKLEFPIVFRPIYNI